MLYAIFSQDVKNSLPLRKNSRSAHIERLNKLKEQGRLIIAGPHPASDSNEPGEAGFTGSLVIAEFTTLQEAEIWANDDPYLQAGVYNQVTIKPFKKVLP
ncbi:MAG: YciI family protein [Gammaproteobacteria bacterium]|nr:YciI family protein [Gammaproteobacteria bacterium]